MKRARQSKTAEHIVFDLDEWKKLRAHFEKYKECDPAFVIGFIEERGTIGTVERMTEPSNATQGRKTVWTRDVLMNLWLMIEIARIKAGSKRLKPFLDELYATGRRRGRKLFSYVDDTGRRTTINDPDTARRLYLKAQRIMADDPKLAASSRAFLNEVIGAQRELVSGN